MSSEAIDWQMQVRQAQALAERAERFAERATARSLRAAAAVMERQLADAGGPTRPATRSPRTA
jgi:hypothetical protein